MSEITNDEARTIAVEVAAIAMRNATDRAAVGMSMRARRDLAGLAYDAIRNTIAAELDEHRDRAEAANNLLANAEYHLTAARTEGFAQARIEGARLTRMKIARALEVAYGYRCPTCGGKAGSTTWPPGAAWGSTPTSRCGGGHTWNGPHTWINGHEAAAIARNDDAEVTP